MDSDISMVRTDIIDAGESKGNANCSLKFMDKEILITTSVLNLGEFKSLEIGKLSKGLMYKLSSPDYNYTIVDIIRASDDFLIAVISVSNSDTESCMEEFASRMASLNKTTSKTSNGNIVESPRERGKFMGEKVIHNGIEWTWEYQTANILPIFTRMEIDNIISDSDTNEGSDRKLLLNLTDSKLNLIVTCGKIKNVEYDCMWITKD